MLSQPRTSLRPSSLAAIALAVLLAGGVLPSRAQPAPSLDRAGIDRAVRAVVAEHGPAIRVGLWLGGPTGDAWYASQADAVLPTASAIKTAFLVELFARYSGALDRTPPGLAEVLRDDHPAVAHFTAAQREEIRGALGDASVRRLGGVMMGSVAASNVVYNAAANAVTALLEGPEALTRAIRGRDPAFAAIAVRRYMLADRKATGDNESTPEALATVLARLASRRVPGLPTAPVDEVRRAILTKDGSPLGRHFFKNGDLASDPATCVRSGWYEDGGRAVVYVVMTAQADPAGPPPAEAHRRLSATATRLTDTLLGAVREAAR